MVRAQKPTSTGFVPQATVQIVRLRSVASDRRATRVAGPRQGFELEFVASERLAYSECPLVVISPADSGVSMELRRPRRLWRRRPGQYRQAAFGFIERAIGQERLFKRAILLTTALAIVVILKVIPWGRYLTAAIATEARRVARQSVGTPRNRAVDR